MKSKNIDYVWGISLREAIFLAMMSVTAIFAKEFINLSLGVPGHSGLLWMAAFVTGKIVINKRLSGSYEGTITGFLALLLGAGKDGVFAFLKFFIPGAFLDVFYLFFPLTWKYWWMVGVWASLAHISKLGVNYLTGMLLGIPKAFLNLGMGLSLIAHLLFGFIGGLLGFIIARKMIKIVSPGAADENRY
jgi:hypothetical protein